jgi:hypothetical protein
MKPGLVISISANIILGTLAFYLIQRAWVPKTPLASPATPATNVEAEAHRTEPTSNAESFQPAINPFHWSQLESTNYRIYVANLRRIGCPEPTIRDIITADVHTLYAPKFQRLESQKTAPATARLGDQLLAQGVETELIRLRNEEDSVISSALDTQATAGQTVAASVRPQRSFRGRAQDGTVSMPLVFQDVDSTVVKPDSRQREIISDLRAKFQEEIGGPNQDPNDPAYSERWKAAQRNSDDMLAGMLGGQFFVEYQLHASDASGK